MNVGQVSHSYLPRIGGIEKYIYNLSRYLLLRGQRVHIYTCDNVLKVSDDRESNTTYCKTTFEVLRNPFSIELYKKLQESDNSIYHLHSPWFISSALATKSLKNKKKIMTVHSATILNTTRVVSALNRFYSPIAQWSLASMDALIVLSRKEKKTLIKRFNLKRDNIYVLPNAIWTEDFERDSTAVNNFARKFHLRPDSYKILSVGRLVSEKNQEMLIKAVNEYLKGQDIQVIVIGTGEPGYVNRLKAQSGDNVEIIGEVPFEELVAAYHSCNLFVFLGTWEGMPTVLLEALYCGLEVLTTPVGAVPDMNREVEGINMLSIHPDAIEVSKRILQCKDDFEKGVTRMTKHQKALEAYSWQNVGSKIFSIYQDVLEARARASISLDKIIK